MSGADDHSDDRVEVSGDTAQPISLSSDPQFIAESIEEPAAAVQLVECWRCHKWVADSADSCPYCEARLKRDEKRFDRLTSSDPSNPYCSTTVIIDNSAGAEKPATRRGTAITSLIWLFLAMLAVSVVQGLIGHAMAASTIRDADLAKSQVTLVLVAEVVDILLVLIALVKIPRPDPLRRSNQQRVAGWFAAVPILAGVLLLNVGYHWLLRSYLRLPDQLPEHDFGKTSFLLVFGMICIQPAIIEELFFRYLALGTLLSVTSVTGAIWMSSIMFGMAHIGAPLSIPILIALGLGLGYARAVSGSIMLPMMMHAVHNLVVMAINGWS